MNRNERPPPSPFVLRCLTRVRPQFVGAAAALDVAMGVGRHCVPLAEAEFSVYGVDRDHARQIQARHRLAERGWCARLWTADLAEGILPSNRFDLVVCTRYLDRALWPGLRATVRPGGFVIYETFTTAQNRYDWGPRSPEHLLSPNGELRRAFGGWDVWEYEECDAPVGEARLLARRPPA